MYINFTNMQILIKNLDKTIRSLLFVKERLEEQRQLLMQNSELEDVVMNLKVTEKTLDSKIEFSRKLRCSLSRIVEINADGEKKLGNIIESDIPKYKARCLPLSNITVISNIKWEIE